MPIAAKMSDYFGDISLTKARVGNYLKESWVGWDEHALLIAAKMSDYFGDISLTKAMVGKYLKESCSSNLNLKLLFK